MVAKPNRDSELQPIQGVGPEDQILSHVDYQIRWYDTNSQRSRRWHFFLRGAQITFAAAIPITQIMPAAVGWRITAGVLGGLIAIAQGFDSMHHYQEHFVAWRTACELLLRERRFYASKVTPYASLEPTSDAARALFATRTADIESQEQQHWITGQLSSGSGNAKKTGA